MPTLVNSFSANSWATVGPFRANAGYFALRRNGQRQTGHRMMPLARLSGLNLKQFDV